uniref:G_PROTEIN_RECEP_F1_2 domain-containing protein n=1 Tax=Syphacia muris TaxID=451379 RepID=A0A0N5AJ33_9BILA
MNRINRYLVCKSTPEFSAFIPKFCTFETEDHYSAKNVCLPTSELSLSGTVFEDFLLRNIVPFICIFGITGNVLNLLVLLSREMRARGNTTLAALAVCDIATLVLVIPHSLAHFDTFGLNLFFRSHYLPYRNHLVGLMNWCSAVTAWLTVLICVERMLALRCPFRIRQMKRSLRNATVLIVAIGFVVTAYEFFAYECFTIYLCGNTQVTVKCYDVTRDSWRPNLPNPFSRTHRDLIKFGALTHVIIALLMPLFILLVMEPLLFSSLKVKSKTLEMLTSNRPLQVQEREMVV